MAQLVDGLPTWKVAGGAQGAILGKGHPIRKHEDVCPGVLDKTKQYRDALDPSTLRFDAAVMQAYQDASIGSLSFHLRLFELLAASIHQIAVFLFKLEPKPHTQEEIQATVHWKRPVEYDDDEEGKHRPLFPEEHFDDPIFYRPSLFFQASYMDHEQYPDGVADVAGYWAEDCIFGGVILFDRGQNRDECNDMYLHSGRHGETFRIWQPTESQFDSMLEFLLAKDIASVSSPFPVSATDLNRVRFDPWDAMARHNIFRDPWERRIPHERPESRDVKDVGDYPEINEMFQKVQEAADAGPTSFKTGPGSILEPSNEDQSQFPWPDFNEPQRTRRYSSYSDAAPIELGGDDQEDLSKDKTDRPDDVGQGYSGANR